MSSNKNCSFLFFDYTDFDVFLNARIFYRLAGYQLLNAKNLAKCDLLVLFRGLPPRIYSEFKGILHFYNYVCEHEIDHRTYFPNASKAFIISILKVKQTESTNKYIYGYLPVIPALWQFKLPFSRKTTIPIHISNYKPLVNDHYQNQLVSLIQAGKIHVYGAKWDRLNIVAKPVSYLEANLRLAKSVSCYGLMYPYQRGRSLSGRMWQGPLQGCVVITEKDTNSFSCPGVFEVSAFDERLPVSYLDVNNIAIESAEFWIEKTNLLARDLDLLLNWNKLSTEVIYCRLLLFSQHNEFLWGFFIAPRIRNVKIKSLDFIRRTIKRIARV